MESRGSLGGGEGRDYGETLKRRLGALNEKSQGLSDMGGGKEIWKARASRDLNQARRRAGISRLRRRKGGGNGRVERGERGDKRYIKYIKYGNNKL
jgi:hypothetical protein